MASWHELREAWYHDDPGRVARVDQIHAGLVRRYESRRWRLYRWAARLLQRAA